MSSRGRVSVRDVADQWWLLSVYDDGWCTEPVAVPTAADIRRRLHGLLGWLAAVAALFAAAVGVGFLLPAVTWLPWVLLAASVAVLALAGARAARRRARRQPPVFASSAAHAAADPAASRVALDAVRAVTMQQQGHEAIVTVAVRRGKPVVYRSPDRTLARLFTGWPPAPPGR